MESSLPISPVRKIPTTQADEDQSESAPILSEREKIQQEPKNTRSRNWLAARIKHVRHFPFEKKGKIELSGQAAGLAGMQRGSIGESSLEFREVQMGVNFEGEIKRIIEKKTKKGDKDSPVRVLDIGAAQSTFLSQLKKRFGKRLDAHSVDIRFFSPEKFPQKRGVDQHIFHVEGLTKILPENHFDMIVDCRGGMLYAQDRIKGLNQVYEVLAPGSSAYIFPKPRSNMRDFFNSDWIKNWADQKGAKFVLQKNGKTRMGLTLIVTKPEETSRDDNI